MDTRGTKATERVKGGHCGRTYIGKTIPTLEVLYEEILVQGYNGRSAYEIR